MGVEGGEGVYEGGQTNFYKEMQKAWKRVLIGGDMWIRGRIKTNFQSPKGGGSE